MRVACCVKSLNTKCTKKHEEKKLLASALAAVPSGGLGDK